MYRYQQKAINYLVTHKRVLLALAPGMGKTFCAIEASKRLGFRQILVVCPLSLVQHWIDEIKRWTGDIAIYSGNGIAKWTITNYGQIVRKPFYNQQWDCVIYDESVLLKNRKAQRTRAAKRLAKASYVWLLSGAPITRYYDDLWAQLNILSSKTYKSYWQFAESYCQIEKSYWGWKIVGNKTDAHKRIAQDCAEHYYAMNHDEAGLSLPEFIIENIEARMGKEQSEMYCNMESAFVAQFHGQQSIATNVLVKALRLIQLCSSPKLVFSNCDITGAKWAVLQELLSFVPMPVVVWTSFVKTAKLLHEQYASARTALLIGEIRNRQYVVDKIQNGEIDFLIAHPAVGKYGLNLSSVRTAIYLERTFNGDDYYQSLYRVKRIGTKFHPYIIHLLSTTTDGQKTIDHSIHRILEMRTRMNQLIVQDLLWHRSEE